MAGKVGDRIGIDSGKVGIPRAKGRSTRRSRRRLEVGTAHLIPEVEKEFRNPAHPYAADAHEMNVFCFSKNLHD